MVELHGIDDAAAEFIILRVWAEHGGKQHTSPDTFGMSFIHID
jgi:hypothetical protein